MDVQPDLVSQVNKLRKDIFWTRCILGLALLCVAALTVANWRRHPQTVEAKEFLLRGHSGNVAARLGQDGFGADAVANEDGDAVFRLVERQHILRSRELSWRERIEGCHVRSLGAT